MKKIVILNALIFAIALSCKKKLNNEKGNISDLSTIENVCPEVQLKANFIKTLVNLPKLQEYINPPEWKSNKHLSILEHSFFDSLNKDSISIMKFGEKVKIIHESEIKDYLLDGVEDFIRIENIDFETDTIHVVLRYEREGVICFTELIEKNCDWIVLKEDIGEE